MKILLVLALLVTLPLHSAELSEAWKNRIAVLASPKTLSASFTESRFTPLKKSPVRIEGIIRIARERGLSLDYARPRSPIVILDEHGLLLRHPDGREQSAPPEAETDLRVLHALFVFDLVTLEKSYDLTPSESPEGGWSLTFKRRSKSDASYRELTLLGEAGCLTGIRLIKTDKQKIEIQLEPPQINPVFTPVENARYFR